MKVNLAVVTVTKIEGREEEGRLAETGAEKREALHKWAGPCNPSGVKALVEAGPAQGTYLSEHPQRGFLKCLSQIDGRGPFESSGIGRA
jgi:hypothetical protein